MKRVLVDTNVALDVLLEREPHLAASAAVWDAVEARVVEGYIAAHGVTTIHYLGQKHLGARGAKQMVLHRRRARKRPAFRRSRDLSTFCEMAC